MKKIKLRKMTMSIAWCAKRVGRIMNWLIYPPSKGKTLFARLFMANKTRRAWPSPPAYIQFTPTAISHWRNRTKSFDALSAKWKATASCPSSTARKTKRQTRSLRISSTLIWWFSTRATTRKINSWCCSSTCWNRRAWSRWWLAVSRKREGCKEPKWMSLF